MDLHADDDKLLRSRNDLDELLRRRRYPWLVDGGVGVGKTRDGRPCVRVLVRTLTSAVLDLIPSHINGIPVRVDEVGKLPPELGPSKAVERVSARRRDRAADEPIALAIVAICVLGVALLAALFVETAPLHYARFACVNVAIGAYVYLVRAYARSVRGWFDAEGE